MKPYSKIKKALNKGIELFKEGELDESLEYLEYAANYGNRRAAYIIGEGCKEFLFDDPTWEKAVKYLKIAADKGDAFCQYQIGLFYRDGAGGLDPSNDEYLKYMNKAAKKGQIDAIEELAYGYSNGIYFETSKEKAVKYFKKGFKKSYNCKYELAKCYLNGLGIKKNEVKAFKLFKEIVNFKAYENNSNLKEAIVYLAECYQNGIGTTKDFHKSLEYYRIANDNGVAGVTEKLVRMKMKNE